MSLTHEKRHRTTAVVLSLLSPGLGHIYLRAWVRALVWFGVVLSAVVLILPTDFLVTITTGTAASIAGIDAQIPTVTLVILAVVSRVLCALDAWLTQRQQTNGETHAHCNACNRSVEVTVEFCHWCLEPVEADVESRTADD
ncbi:DUF6677 family protein [Natrinema gelatinilyticum]|uniref:DUF6677 family protein n=1 Tax=Natrinema gelatinilyticum TaxID=2961571 RepID=UPI0020C2F81E|nr:DUF6677 family protein [Natrinema gelatinilyticum]